MSHCKLWVALYLIPFICNVLIHALFFLCWILISFVAAVAQLKFYLFLSFGRLPGCCAVFFFFIPCCLTSEYVNSDCETCFLLHPSVQEQSPSNATSLAMMQEPQEVVEETVTIEEDPGTPTSHVSVVTSDDGTTRRTETKVKCKGACLVTVHRQNDPAKISHWKVLNKYQKKSTHFLLTSKLTSYVHILLMLDLNQIYYWPAGKTDGPVIPHYGANIQPGSYCHTLEGYCRAVALLWHSELLAAKTQKAPLIHFNMASNYGYRSLLPNHTVLYLHSQTSILKNSKYHNPTAQSGFISLSWLYLFAVYLLLCYYESTPLVFS